MARPIAQTIPPAEGQAGSEPGVAGRPWATEDIPRMSKRGTNDRRMPLRTPVYHRRYIQRGITHYMSYGAQAERAPGIQLPIRSSLAQIIHIHKVELSHYVSWIKPFGMRRHYPDPNLGLGDYPTAKVPMRLNITPRIQARSRPRINQVGGAPSQPRVSRPGTMAPPPRFRKALPVAMVQYVPPTY